VIDRGRRARRLRSASARLGGIPRTLGHQVEPPDPARIHRIQGVRGLIVSSLRGWKITGRGNRSQLQRLIHELMANFP
jgi:hypothetical protein